MHDDGACILCGTTLRVAAADAHRERALCPCCGVNARLRGVILGVLRAVAADPLRPLHTLPPRREIRAVGISDHPACAAAFAEAFDYTNTFFHCDPLLDICDAAAAARFGGCDLVVCSDVIEHTLRPPAVTIANLLAMLRPGGALVLSAPTFRIPATIEWYGGVTGFTIAREAEGFAVHWTDLRGQTLIDRRPIFHGGPGTVLEMRVIAADDLLDVARRLAASVEVLAFAPAWGYAWRFVREFPYLDGEDDGRILILRR